MCIGLLQRVHMSLYYITVFIKHVCLEKNICAQSTLPPAEIAL